MPSRILIVDDDENIVRLLRLYLENEGFELESAKDGSEALTRFRSFRPDLVLLDVMLPEINGWEVLHLLRAESNVPVVMITSRDMIEDKVRGFTLGADDYVVKPFDPREVMVRIHARLRGGDAPAADSSREKNEHGVAVAGDLRVDLNRYEVWLGRERMSLKPKEIQLIYFLIRNRNLVFSRDQLLEKVWGDVFLVDTRTVDAHVRRLRLVLGAEGSGWVLRTVWGVGYKFEVK